MKVHARALRSGFSGGYLSMKKNLNRIILSLILLAGILADGFVLWQRIDAELEDRNVAAAVYYHDAVRLERYSGISSNEWLSTFAASGVRYVIFGTQPSRELLEYMSGLDMQPAAMGNLEGDWAFVVPMENKPLRDIGDTPLALMKNSVRTDIVAPADFVLGEYGGPTVKAGYLYAGFAARYTDESGPKEVENVLFRAITDEGIRLLLLRPICYADHSIVLDPAAYTEMLSSLESRLIARGHTYGESFSLLDVGAMSPLTIWLTGLVPVALWVFLATRFSFLKRFGPALSILGLVGTAGAVYIMPQLAQKVLALSCSLGCSLIMVWWLYMNFVKGDRPRFKSLPSYLLSLAALFVWSVLGGLAVSAIQSDISYLMGDSIFTGVKFSMMLPIAVCGLVFALPILRRVIKRDFSRGELLSMLPAAALILVALFVLVRRSGDTYSLSQLETTVRSTLEYTFYARPRTKEILVAVPFMSLLFVSVKRRDSILPLIGALCCSIECTSILNSFSHGFTPLHVSFLRSFLAAICGAPLGAAVIGALLLLSLVIKKIKARPESL